MSMFDSIQAAVNLGRLARFTSATLFPATCCLCGGPGQPLDLDLCGTCDAALPRNRVGRDWPAGLAGLGAVYAPLAYAPPVDHLVRALKYHEARVHARVLATLMLRDWRRAGVPLPDLLVPVPLHRARRSQRGFNQAELIARHLARELRVPLGNRLVERLLPTQPQSALSPLERRRNVHRAFRVLPGAAQARLAVTARVAIVDDVLTTGSTAIELARTIAACGPRVDAWVAARAMPRALPAAERVVQQHADEHRHAHELIVSERAEAAGRVAIADQPLLIDEENAGADESERVPDPELHAVAGEVQREQHHRL